MGKTREQKIKMRVEAFLEGTIEPRLEVILEGRLSEKEKNESQRQLKESLLERIRAEFPHLKFVGTGKYDTAIKSHYFEIHSTPYYQIGFNLIPLKALLENETGIAIVSIEGTDSNKAREFLTKYRENLIREGF